MTLIIDAVTMREDCEEDLLDVGCNVDLYVANQEIADSLHEEHVGDILFAFNERASQVKISINYKLFRSLSRPWLSLPITITITIIVVPFVLALVIRIS